jgi:GNAT superfamily N-acetyltransferase
VTIEIREARPEEYEEAGRVTAEAYREFVEPEDPHTYLDRIGDIGARADRTTILVAVEDGRVLGSLTLELEGRVGDWGGDPPLRAGEAHIRMLGVAPASRSRGVGGALMRRAEERARRAGKTFITLDTTEAMRDAQRMYGRLGFVRGTDHVFPDGFVLLGYRKELSADGST